MASALVVLGLMLCQVGLGRKAFSVRGRPTASENDTTHGAAFTDRASARLTLRCKLAVTTVTVVVLILAAFIALTPLEAGRGQTENYCHCGRSVLSLR